MWVFRFFVLCRWLACEEPFGQHEGVSASLTKSSPATSQVSTHSPSDGPHRCIVLLPGCNSPCPGSYAVVWESGQVCHIHPARRTPADPEMASAQTHDCCALRCSGGRNRTTPITLQVPLQCLPQISTFLSHTLPLSLTRARLTRFAPLPLQAAHDWSHPQHGRSRTS